MPNRGKIFEGDGDPRHGTYNGYNNLGCRCPECSAANVRQMAQNRARRKAQIDPNDPRHGTVTFYWNHGCTCERCRTANTEYAAKRKANKGTMLNGKKRLKKAVKR